MKIAFFVNAFPMMSEAFIANSAAALIDQGHSVDIFGVGNVPATGLSVKAVERHQLEQNTVNMSHISMIMSGQRPPAISPIVTISAAVRSNSAARRTG